MKTILFFIFLLLCSTTFCQKDRSIYAGDSVELYRYRDSTKRVHGKQAVLRVKEELLRTPKYVGSIFGNGIVFVGGALWNRYRSAMDSTKSLRDYYYYVDLDPIDSSDNKQIYNWPEYELFWTQLRNELGKKVKVRLATTAERDSIWCCYSPDFEPLVIAESKKFRVVLNFIFLPKLQLYCINGFPFYRKYKKAFRR